MASLCSPASPAAGLTEFDVVCLLPHFFWVAMLTQRTTNSENRIPYFHIENPRGRQRRKQQQVVRKGQWFLLFVFAWSLIVDFSSNGREVYCDRLALVVVNIQKTPNW